MVVSQPAPSRKSRKFRRRKARLESRFSLSFPSPHALICRCAAPLRRYFCRRVRMGWGREARGRRQAAGGRQQAAGELPTGDEACTGRGRSGPGHVRPVDHVRPVHHVRPVDAVHHGYVLSCRSRSVAERYLRRRAKHAWRRRRAAESMMMRMTRVRMWHKHGVLRWRDNIIWSSAA